MLQFPLRRAQLFTRSIRIPWQQPRLSARLSLQTRSFPVQFLRLSTSSSANGNDLDKNKQAPPKIEVSKEIYTIPNILTMTRIVSTPFIGYFLATGHSTAAISLFTYSCVTDFVDGFIARRYNQKSALGSILDPAADKFLMTVCTTALFVSGAMPGYVAGLIIGRDVLLSFAAFFVRYRSLPHPKTWLRYIDMSIVTHTVHPNMLGKVNTALQMVYIGGLVLAPVLEYSIGSADSVALFFSYFGALVACTTFASGASYIVGRNAVKKVI